MYARTENVSEQANQLVFLQIGKRDHFITALVLALMLQLLDDPGGEQGGGVAKADLVHCCTPSLCWLEAETR